ncbi:DUF3667 domain-containing protein [Christiangramia fulva]|nr:DUF3667 domain-containing protein [Christiangramia fulva]
MKYRGNECLNCGHPLELTQRFCPRCGQMNSAKKLKFDDFFNEFFSSLFAYDSRFNRTLRVLMFKPGKISRDYIQGKRVRYANPFRFYLSASIIFFLIFNYSVDIGNSEFGPQDKDLQNLKGEEVPPIPPEVAVDSINKIITSPEVGLESIRPDSLSKKTYKDDMISENDLNKMSMLDAISKRFTLYYEYQDETGIYNSQRALDSLGHDHNNYNNWLYKKAVDAGIFKNNPRLFIDYFISKLPFIIFFYLPVFALFIWLLYVRRPFNYMEHLVFAFHVQTTLFVLYIFGLLIDLIIGKNWGIITANFLFAFYLYKSMRNFYQQNRVKTVLKFLILNVIFFTLAMAAIAVSLLASFSIY